MPNKRSIRERLGLHRLQGASRSSSSSHFNLFRRTDTLQATPTGTSAAASPHNNAHSGPRSFLGPSGSEDNDIQSENTAFQSAKKAEKLFNMISSLTKRTEAFIDDIPGAKLSLGLFNTIVDIVQTVKNNKEQADAFLDVIVHHIEIAEELLSRHPDDKAKKRVKDFIKELQQTNGKLEKIKGQKNWGQVLQVDKDAQTIKDIIATLDQATETFALGIMALIQTDMVTMKKMLEMDQWPYSPSAWYNAGHAEETKIFRRACTKGTRASILSQIKDWAVDRSDKSPPIFWLSGMAGSGKSTIAYSICEYFNDHHRQDCRLASSFFCSRQVAKLRQRHYIIPTITHHLMEHSVAFADALIGVPKLGPDIHSPEKQMDGLLIEPWQSSFKNQIHPLLVVIDALDEVELGGGAKFIKDLITKGGPKIRGLKLLITSRPDPAIVSECKEVEERYKLEDVDPKKALEDIRCFLKEELQDLSKENAEGLEKIAQQSQGLFIYASTAVRYICPPGEQLSCDEQLDGLNHMLKGGPSRNHWGSAGLQLDGLYKLIVHGVLGDKKRQKVFKFRRSILETLVCIQQPLSIASISNFTPRDDGKCDAKAVENAIKALHAVMYVSEKDNCVYIYHKSFFDFLLTSDRAGKELACKPSNRHSILAQHCLAILNSLDFNMCKLPSSFLLDAEVPNLQQTVETVFHEMLRYCCLFWVDHWLKGSEAANANQLLDSLQRFGEEKGLFWIEAMNLLKENGKCSKAANEIKQYILKNETSAEHLKTTMVALDRLATIFGNSAAALSTPHLYISSLATEIATGTIPAKWREQFRALPHVECVGVSNRGGEIISMNIQYPVYSVAFSQDSSRIVSGSHDGAVIIWDATTGNHLQTLEGHTSGVHSVAFSHDNSRIVSGSEDETVIIWDATTGSHLQTLEGHTSSVHSVAFSHNNFRIVSGSWDDTVKIWDASTGDCLQTLEGHTLFINSVAFSHDSSQIVSGSWDKTVKTWDTCTGDCLQTLKGHTMSVKSVAFSHDSSRIISGSSDATVRIWNAFTGHCLQTLEGHAQSVNSVVFSHDSFWIVSGSYETIRIWDASTGHCIQTLEGHTDDVRSVAFSHDSSRIVSGSDDKTFRIWDASTGNHLQTLQGHTNRVNSVAFSHDSSRIVSGSSDKTVRIWDASTGDHLQTLEGHTYGVTSVAFSHDNSRIVSSSFDDTVRIWDASTGTHLQTSEGHTNWVSSVAFSHDSSRIVSGSHDGAVIIWDTCTGDCLQTLKGHTMSVKSVAFSHDSSRIVSGSYDETVRIWDASTGDHLQTLEGPTSLNSVAFSHENSKIVSGSDDKTVRIWDASTGDCLQTLDGHSGWVKSAAFSHDSSRIVSGSYDKTVRIWDVSTGHCLQILQGHTSRVLSVAFSHDSSLIVSSSHDNTIQIWDATTRSASPSEDLTVTTDQSGWMIHGSSQSQNRIMWLPSSLAQTLLLSQCVTIISRSPRTRVFYQHHNLGPNWTRCYDRQAEVGVSI